jgi:hypothetical protein
VLERVLVEVPLPVFEKAEVADFVATAGTLRVPQAVDVFEAVVEPLKVLDTEDVVVGVGLALARGLWLADTQAEAEVLGEPVEDTLALGLLESPRLGVSPREEVYETLLEGLTLGERVADMQPDTEVEAVLESEPEGQPEAVRVDAMERLLRPVAETLADKQVLPERLLAFVQVLVRVPPALEPEGELLLLLVTLPHLLAVRLRTLVELRTALAVSSASTAGRERARVTREAGRARRAAPPLGLAPARFCAARRARSAEGPALPRANASCPE